MLGRRAVTVSDRPTVMIVDDEESAADVYALRLDGEYDTVVAYSGRTALDRIDDEIDVVLLDRRMPELSGQEVLAALRERRPEVSVIMLTAVDPGLEVVEMPFDDYITKPVEKDELVTAIDRQIGLDRGETRAEYHEVKSKLSLLERKLPPKELESGTLEQLRDRAERLRDRLDASDQNTESDRDGHGSESQPDESRPQH